MCSGPWCLCFALNLPDGALSLGIAHKTRLTAVSDAMNRVGRWIARVSVIYLVFTVPSFAVERESLYGEWGTESQCARAVITPEGTKHASPFDIQPDWMRQGGVWCRLIWTSTVLTPEGIFATASSLCGEDAVRDYQIKFELSGETLMLTWSQGTRNGPLSRCPVK